MKHDQCTGLAATGWVRFAVIVIFAVGLMMVLAGVSSDRARALAIILPDSPTFTVTDPASPAGDNRPRIMGAAEEGAIVDLYTNPLCMGTSVARGSAATFTGDGISVTVDDDSTTPFYATAEDQLGIRSLCSADSITYVEDSTGPETSIEGGPSGNTGPNPTFTFTSAESGATFLSRLDTGEFEACSSPRSYSGLAGGPHAFEVKAVDAAGNADPSPAGRDFIVDASIPETTVDSGPDGPTDDASPTFEFRSSEPNSTFRCRLDEGDFEACTSPTTYEALADGDHTLSVEATDATGETDPTPATRTFTVDTTGPRVGTIGARPSSFDISKNRKMKILFSIEEDGASSVTVGIERDGQPVKTLEPAELDGSATLKRVWTGTGDDGKTVRNGAYEIVVRATDRAGNTTTRNVAVKVKR